MCSCVQTREARGKTRFNHIQSKTIQMMDDDSTGFYSNFSILHVWEFLHWCAFKGEGLGCYMVLCYTTPHLSRMFLKNGGWALQFSSTRGERTFVVRKHRMPGTGGRVSLASKKKLRTDNPRFFLGSWTSVLIQYLTDPSRRAPTQAHQGMVRPTALP